MPTQTPYLWKYHQLIFDKFDKFHSELPDLAQPRLVPFTCGIHFTIILQKPALPCLLCWCSCVPFLYGYHPLP